MSKICSYCGQTLQDHDVFCDRCGQSQQFQQSQQPRQPQETPVYAAPMKPKKQGPKWWMIAVPAVLVVVLVVALLWNTIAFAIAPQAVLAGALAKTAGKLEERSEGTPMAMISKAYEDMEDSVNIAIAAEYSDEYNGDMIFDINMMTDIKNKRVLFDGNFTMYEETFDAMLYMDAGCAALGSNRFSGGEYYGITYETFSEDLRASILYDSMDEESIEEMEKAVEMIEEYWANMGQEEQTGLSEECMQVLKEYYESLEMETGSEKLSLGGKERSCKTVTYLTTWGDMAEMYVDLMEAMADDPAFQAYIDTYVAAYNAENAYYGYEMTSDEMIDAMIDSVESMDDYFDGDITVMFYLYKNVVAAVDLNMVLDDGDEEVEINAQILLGENPAKDDIEILLEANADGENLEFEVICTKETDGKEVSEMISFSGDSGYEKIGAELGYIWDAESGDLELSIDVSSDGDRIGYDFDLTLLEIDGGFKLAVDDVYDLLSDAFYDEFECGVSMTVTKGEEISVPTYHNIDTWTEEDIMEIGENISSMG